MKRTRMRSGAVEISHFAPRCVVRAANRLHVWRSGLLTPSKRQNGRQPAASRSFVGYLLLLRFHAHGVAG